MIALDSSFLIAFKVGNDANHEKATELMKKVVSGDFGKPFIADYIFDETVTGIFIRSKNLKIAVGYGKELMASLRMFEISEEIFGEAWHTFSDQNNKQLSFTDCTTIAVMNLRDAEFIATFDRDFQDIEKVSSIGL